MSFAEKKIFEITGIVRRTKMSALLQRFLSDNKLIPGDPKDEAFHWIKEDSHGTKVPLQMDCLYIVLEGSLRLMIDKRGGGVVYMKQQKEEVSIEIKRDAMPLVILEAGSFLSIEDDFFDFLRDYETEDCAIVSERTQARSGEVTTSTGVDSAEHHLNIFFDRSSRYLCIPKYAVERSLRTESLEDQPIIRKELEQMGQLLKTRMKHVRELVHIAFTSWR